MHDNFLQKRLQHVTIMSTYILFYSILLDYQSLYGHGKEDESGLSSCDLLGSDAGTVPPDERPGLLVRGRK